MSTPNVTATRQAVILAGGNATRLRPYTDDRPKPLVDVAGKTIFERQVEWLAGGGIEHVVVACGYLADVFEEFVRTTPLPVDVTIVREKTQLGRGGGLKFGAGALPFPGEPWMGCNGDVLTDAPIDEILLRHVTTGAAATVAVAQYRCPYGVLDIADDESITSFVEAPLLPYWINAGIYVFAAATTALLPDVGDHEDSTFPRLARENRLFAYRIGTNWRGIDTVKDLKEATKALA
ncbi:MAG TPA: nucleotidyltransferase family protein [Pseudonocardiaceae bacterium]|nr:nucleotidyltransferase family protein [Pseudonocardiaceae bacterium]